MTNDDGQAKNPEKERVLAAIAALKAQGADINPYTVSGEAQVPRSTLYRDPELMDLIHRERNHETDNNISNDEFASKIAELEETNSSLNEQIWELEKQLESMTKLKQDAYVQGFQAGIEEAAKRYGVAAGEARAGQPGEDEYLDGAEHLDVVAEAVVPEQEPVPVAAGLGETGYQYSEPASPPSNGEIRGSRRSNIEENTGDYGPSIFDYGRPNDSLVAGDYQFGDSLTGNSFSDEDSNTFDASVANEAGEAESLGSDDLHDVQADQSAHPHSIQEQSGEEGEEHDIFDDIESVLREQSDSPAAQKSSRNLPDIDFSLADERPPERTPKKNFPDIDFGLASEHDESNESNGESHYNEADDRERVTANARAGSDELSASQVARSADGIYNIARSGPTISSSAYNPLVELSWKDLQTVYNFSVASLKDYAKPGFGNEPGPLGGTNFADPTTHERPSSSPAPSTGSSPSGSASAGAPHSAVHSQQGSAQTPSQPKPARRAASAEPPDIPMMGGQDPRRTGDRLQALSDPRNLLDSEPIVDLDALDIFDDLDDYVDLDKIEVINDVVAKPNAQAEEPSKGGDELRELIKGRIKQASEMAHEPSAPRMTTPPGGGSGAAAGKDDAKGAAAAGGGARNKFVGAAKAGQTPEPPVSNFVVKSIPPEIRKACMILGLKPEEATQRAVIEAWKKQIASPGVHPDLGGDTEAAVFLNTAKDTLVRWLDAQAPKLGKKFGAPPRPAPSDKEKD